MVMDKRLAMGYSDRELSFLLGYRAQYVRDVEDPTHTLRYSSKDTNYLQQILDCRLKEIMPPKLADSFYHIHIDTTSNMDGSKTYTITRELKNKRKGTYRGFTTGASLAPTAHTAADVEQIQTYIRHLFSIDYFDEPKTALEVFRKCIRRFGKPLQPDDIARAIAFYTGK